MTKTQQRAIYILRHLDTRSVMSAERMAEHLTPASAASVKRVYTALCRRDLVEYPFKVMFERGHTEYADWKSHGVRLTDRGWLAAYQAARKELRRGAEKVSLQGRTYTQDDLEFVDRIIADRVSLLEASDARRGRTNGNTQ